MEDKNKSYSIYIDRRPHKTLYIFNKTGLSFEKLDKIIEYNLRKWGGRYNFVMVAHRNLISADQWKFLKLYDPDFVRLSIPITKSLAIDLDTKITPLQVVNGERHQSFSPHSEHEGISILPTSRNIRTVSNALGSEVRFVLFNIDECQDETIKKFITRNFGILDLREMSNQALNQYPQKQIIRITDKQSFIEALMSFNDFKPYVFPIQLSSIGDFISDDRSIDHEDSFYAFIGDSPMDLLDSWNNPFYLQSWTRNRLRQIWIPTSIAEDPELVEALKKFIHGRADPYGNGQKKVIFSSRTLIQTRLENIANNLTDGTWLFKEIRIKSVESYPNYSDYFSFDRIKVDMLHLRGSGKEEKIIVPAPEIEEGVMGGECWMNDLYVQIPEKKVVPVNFETWLQLPQNNSITHTVVEGIARMTNNGFPSVLTSRSSQFHPVSQELTVKLPKTWDTFASMIMNTGKPCFTNDLRAPYTKPYKHTISVSSAGKHIHGFLDVFGSLDGAYQTFEKKHWRTLFDLMGNVTEEKEKKRLNQIKANLEKKVRAISSYPNNFTNGRFTEWLSHEIQKAAKVYLAANPKAVPFSELEKIAKSELVEYNTRNPSNKYKYSKKQVVEALSWLTDVGAILIGYELTCPSCLNKDWRALDDVSQLIECRGCGHEYTFSPETKIKYKLNTVLENGIRMHGVVPVILALGSIFRNARHYFDFLPPVDIFKKGKKLTDLDVCCVIDGQFVIGEVKARHKLFNPSDFRKIADIAKEIHPNKVIFCSLDERISQRRKDQVDEVRNELAPLDITVEWLHFEPWIYKASPIY